MDLTLYYAAVATVENGTIGEVELSETIEDTNAGTTTQLSVFIRRDVRPLEITTQGEPE